MCNTKISNLLKIFLSFEMDLYVQPSFGPLRKNVKYLCKANEEMGKQIDNTENIINKLLTDCLSSSSCFRSQSASERTIVSCGSEVEERPPRLGEGRAEERGVKGITVSSSILRSY